jgi:hypothetical protein
MENIMATELEISARISQLKSEAAQAGDLDMVAACNLASGHELYDSETAEMIDPDELFPRSPTPIADYVEAIQLSLNEGTDEGHVHLRNAGGRKVYAA